MVDAQVHRIAVGRCVSDEVIIRKGELRSGRIVDSHASSGRRVVDRNVLPSIDQCERRFERRRYRPSQLYPGFIVGGKLSHHRSGVGEVVARDPSLVTEVREEDASVQPQVRGYLIPDRRFLNELTHARAADAAQVGLAGVIRLNRRSILQC